jgi:hypothetical protein
MSNTGRIPLWLVGLVGGLAVITVLSFIYFVIFIIYNDEPKPEYAP